MSFFRWIQNSKMFIHYITIVIVIVGAWSMLVMQREARPNVDFNRVTVSVAYPGASPSDIEELVIDPIEEKIDEVDGVEEYRSVSYSGAGSISIKVDDNYPDPKEVVDEIRRKITEVRDLPEEVEDPAVSEVKAINIPVLRMALYGNLPPFEMKLEVEKLRDYLSTFDGVQSVSYAGLEDLQLKVLADPSKLDLFDITLVEVMSGLSNWSRQRPGGLLENTRKAVNLTVGVDYNEVAKLEDFIVRSNDSGKGVKLADFAKIEYGLESSQLESLYGDKSAVLITIVKKPASDIVRTVDEVRGGLEQYVNNLPKGLEYKFYSDQAVRVRDRLSTVTQNAVFGLLLVLVLLIIFLDWRSAVVTSIGIPVAILGGFVVIYMTGNTLNSLVLVGMIIVLGMLVDDAIVVCENIYSYIEAGDSPATAALKGVKEISIPVVATVLTTVFAFLPILFMEDIIGQFLRVIPLTVIAMLLISLFESLIILPVHAEEIMRSKKEKKASLFSRVEDVYRKYLRWTVRYRWLVLVVMVFVFAGSIMQGKYLFERFTLFPATGLEGLSVRVEMDKNTPIDQTAEVMKKLSAQLEEVSEGTFDSLFSTIGQVTTGGSAGSRQNASHLGQLEVSFTSDPGFINIEKRILRSVQQVTRKFAAENNVKTSVTIDRPGPPVGKPIQFEVTSRDLEFGGRVVDQLKAEFAKMDGVHSLETDLDGDSTKYRFLVDNDLAVADGVDPSNISRTIFAAATGTVTSEILKSNEKVEIMVGLREEQDIDLKEILDLKVRNTNAQAVPIGTFAREVRELGPSSIQRLNGIRTITLFGEVDEKVITGKEANARIAPFVAQLKAENPTLRIDTGGGEKDRINALKDTGRLYLLALLLIFMVISLSFQSVIYPFIVLISIPMGICGVIWALRLHGQPLSLMGIIGIVGLSGVVVNISIILLSFIKNKIAEGTPLKEAVVMGGVRRLRPILITTITTLIGLIPMIYGIGGTDTFVQPLAMALGWGLFVATGLSVLTMPALISLISILDRKKGSQA